jgi:hypothetical protein
VHAGEAASRYQYRAVSLFDPWLAWITIRNCGNLFRNCVT